MQSRMIVHPAPSAVISCSCTQRREGTRLLDVHEAAARHHVTVHRDPAKRNRPGLHLEDHARAILDATGALQDVALSSHGGVSRSNAPGRVCHCHTSSTGHLDPRRAFNDQSVGHGPGTPQRGGGFPRGLEPRNRYRATPGSFNFALRCTHAYAAPEEATITTTVAAPVWTPKDAEKLYNMSGWGLGYFRVNAEGHVTVHPDGDPKRGLDLYQLATDLDAQGVGLPLLLRFSDILRSRIATLAGHFAHAIKEFGYEGRYTTVYPIKVNQQRHVVQEVVEFGEEFGVGLECGSKPELMAILGLSDSSHHLIVCNGYKDEEFMRLALMGQKLGHNVIIVIEQLNELDVLLKVADEMQVEPSIGVRIKLSSEGSGRWAKSGGEKSKFGLSPVELVQLLDRLQALKRAEHPQAGALPSRQPDHRHPLREGGTRRGLPLLRRAAAHGVRGGLRGRGWRPWRRLRRLALDPHRQHELHHARVRQRRHLHPGHRLPQRRGAHAQCHLRVGSRHHGAPCAAADQRHRRGDAERDVGAGAGRGSPPAARGHEGEPRVAHARARGGGVP